MTSIYPDTRISEIIKANRESIEVIAGISAPLQKLRNPLLRKVLASRTTLSEAARLGGCSLAEMAGKLAPLGFVFTDRPAKGAAGEKKVRTFPDFIRSVTDDRQTVLDVRGELEEGNDPLKKIMAAAGKLPQEHVLKIINSFEPIPLIRLLENKGFESYIKRVAPDEVHAFFKRRADGRERQEVQPVDLPELVDEAAFSAGLSSFGAKTVPIDVSGMEMPMPMVTILNALNALPEGHALSVCHKRIPVFLFDELKERNFRYLVCRFSDTLVRLLIYRS